MRRFYHYGEQDPWAEPGPHDLEDRADIDAEIDDEFEAARDAAHDAAILELGDDQDRPF